MTFQHDDLADDLLRTFQAEATEHLEVLNKALLRLERVADDKQHAELLQGAFRAAHNLKGAARTVNLYDIEGLAHAIENVLHRARDGKLTLDPAACDVLYAALDAGKFLLSGQDVALEPVLARLAPLYGDTPIAAPPAVEPVPDLSPHSALLGEDTIRVAVGKLDNLMAHVSELMIAKLGMEQHLADMDVIERQLASLPRLGREIKALLARVDGPTGQKLAALWTGQQEHLQALIHEIDLLHQSIYRNTVQFGILANQIQDEVRRVRTVPFQSLALGLERVLRDAARSEDKQVAPLVIEGGEVELDKKVLEALKDPLIHLLRNAVSHGIESAPERLERDKPPEGCIRISVQQRGSEVRIAVSDDGRGFDLVALRQASASNGGHALGEQVSPDEIIGLAFLPGITTATSVTALAGRGVGLDVVRRCLEMLQGRIVVDNAPARGATIQLTVPVSLVMTRGLLVRVGMERYMLPLLSVERVMEPQQGFTVEGQTMISLDGKPCPLVSLAEVLRRPGSATRKGRMLMVVLRVAEQRVALLVDDVLSDQEFAVKPLSRLLRPIPNVAGAALLGNGEPVIVLNAAELIRSGRSVSEAPVSGNGHLMDAQSDGDAPETSRILVVDDSITTRTLEKNILQASGYIVITATDGQEALRRLREHAIDLIVADVQMPNMDGFALTRYLRSSAEYADLPIILVTSLESPEDREQGLMAGANAYIVKRGFDQGVLLSTIRQLL